jgi:hypothetical protein
MIEDKSLRVRKLITGRMLPAFITAYALGILIQFFAWRLELRSVVKLLWQGGLIALAIFPLAYWVIKFEPSQLTWKALRSAFFALIPLAVVGALLIPAQRTEPRFYLAAGIFTAASFMVLLGLAGLRISRRVENFGEYFLWIAFGGGVIAATVLLINGTSVRMYADDFIYTLERLNRGYWTGLVWFYLNWSGRIMSNFLVMGLADWRWLPFAQITAIIVTTFITFYYLVKDSLLKKVAAAIFATGWILFAVAAISPDFYKSIYWIVSSTSSLPVMFLIPLYILVVWISENGKKKPNLWLPGSLAALLSLMIATTHEAVVIGWVAAQVFVLIASGVKFKQLKRWQILVLAGAAAGILGFALQVFSPGNLYRGDKQSYTQTVQLLPLLQGTLTYYVSFLKSIPASGWLLLLSLIGVGALIPTGAARSWKWTAAILITAQLISASCFIAGVYIFSGPIPLRTQFIPAAYLAYGMLAAGLFLPRPGSKQVAVSCAVVFAALSVIISIPNLSRLASTMQPMRQFAQDWDERDALGRQDSANLYMIDIPWEDHEAKFISVQEYYRRIDAIPDTTQ